MPKFPSKEWVEGYVEKLNSNPAYEDAGKTWEGDIVFVVEADQTYPKTSCVYLDLYHGKCRKSSYLEECGEFTTPKSEFQYIGTYGNWIKLMKREIDPIQGLMTGKFKLKGPMMKIMRYSKAAKEMVSTASLVESDTSGVG
jgi:putative sterol carrier protein